METARWPGGRREGPAGSPLLAPARCRPAGRVDSQAGCQDTEAWPSHPGSPAWRLHPRTPCCSGLIRASGPGPLLIANPKNLTEAEGHSPAPTWPGIRSSYLPERHPPPPAIGPCHVSPAPSQGLRPGQGAPSSAAPDWRLSPCACAPRTRAIKMHHECSRALAFPEGPASLCPSSSGQGPLGSLKPQWGAPRRGSALVPPTPIVALLCPDPDRGGPGSPLVVVGAGVGQLRPALADPVALGPGRGPGCWAGPHQSLPREPGVLGPGPGSRPPRGHWVAGVSAQAQAPGGGGVSAHLPGASVLCLHVFPGPAQGGCSASGHPCPAPPGS